MRRISTTKSPNHESRESNSIQHILSGGTPHGYLNMRYQVTTIKSNRSSNIDHLPFALTSSQEPSHVNLTITLPMQIHLRSLPKFSYFLGFVSGCCWTYKFPLKVNRCLHPQIGPSHQSALVSWHLWGWPQTRPRAEDRLNHCRGTGRLTEIYTCFTPKIGARSTQGQVDRIFAWKKWDREPKT